MVKKDHIIIFLQKSNFSTHIGKLVNGIACSKFRQFLTLFKIIGLSVQANYNGILCFVERHLQLIPKIIGINLFCDVIGIFLNLSCIFKAYLFFFNLACLP